MLCLLLWASLGLIKLNLQTGTEGQPTSHLSKDACYGNKK